MAGLARRLGLLHSDELVLVTHGAGSLGSRVIRQLMHCHANKQEACKLHIRVGFEDVSEGKTRLTDAGIMCESESEAQAEGHEDLAKADKAAAPRVRVAHTDYFVDSSLERFLCGGKLLIIIPPNSKDKAQKVNHLLRLAVQIHSKDKSDIQHVILLSHALLDEDTVFGSQFAQIERNVRECGLPYTIVRAPIFFENLKVLSKSVRENGKLTCVIDKDAPLPLVAMHDAAQVVAHIAMEPSKFNGNIYIVPGERAHTFEEISRILHSLLGRPVTYEKLDNQTWQNELMQSKLPDWQCLGMVQSFERASKSLYGGSTTAGVHGQTLSTSEQLRDFGVTPIELEPWLKQHLQLFQQTSTTGSNVEPMGAGAGHNVLPVE